MARVHCVSPIVSAADQLLAHAWDALSELRAMVAPLRCGIVGIHVATRSVIAWTQACTIVVRGASSHLLDEAERSLHDALCVLSQVRRAQLEAYEAGNA